jgi:hypothetical protein
VESSCEHGNETSGFIKDKGLLDYLSDHQFLKNSCMLIRSVFSV